MNTSDIFPTSLPPENRWIVADNSFEPSRVWHNKDAVCIKKNARRRVIRAGEYFLKFFRTGSPVVRKLRDPAWKEYKTACHLTKFGVTAPPVAWVYHDGWSCFVSKNIPGTDLDSFLKNSWHHIPRKTRKEICKCFAELLVTLANAGFFQPDFHLNNILFDNNNLKFSVIDLHRARLYDGPLNQQYRKKQLVFVIPPFIDRISNRYIAECAWQLKKYWPELASRKERFYILDSAYYNMRLHWKKRGLSRIKHLWNRHNLKRGYIITADSCPEPAKIILRDFQANPESVIKMARIIKNSRHTLCLKVNTEGQFFFLKAYRSSSAIKALSYLLRPPKARHIWNISWLIWLRHLPVALPYAVLQHINPWDRFYGAIIYPWNEQAACETGKTSIALTMAKSEKSQSMLRTMAQELWTMHQKGVFHGDAKITNFIFDQNGRIKLFFDIDSTAILVRSSDSLRKADITALAAAFLKLATRMQSMPESTGYVNALVSAYMDIHIPWRKKREHLTDCLLQSATEKFKKGHKRRQIQKDSPDGD